MQKLFALVRKITKGNLLLLVASFNCLQLLGKSVSWLGSNKILVYHIHLQSEQVIFIDVAIENCIYECKYTYMYSNK